MHHFCKNLNTVIASSTVIKWSHYVFKHGQCRVLIDSKDLACKYSGIQPIGQAHLSKPHATTTYTAGNLIWHVIMRPETTKVCFAMWGNAIFSLIKDWSAVLIVHDKAVARNLPSFFCYFHPLSYLCTLAVPYMCTRVRTRACIFVCVWVRVPGWESECARQPCQTPLLSVM